MSDILNIFDFVMSADRMMFSARRQEIQIEICLEKCAGGFDIGVYDLNEQLLEPKICTDDEGYLDDYASMVSDRTVETWIKALEIANKLYEKYRNRGKHEP